MWCQPKCTGPSTGGSRSGTSGAAHGTSEAATSATGTAYIGTTRRGSHTSTASVVSSTGTPSSEARTRLVTGSYRSCPSRLIRCSPMRIAISRCCASRLPRSTPVRRAERAAGHETLST